MAVIVSHWCRTPAIESVAEGKGKAEPERALPFCCDQQMQKIFVTP